MNVILAAPTRGRRRCARGRVATANAPRIANVFPKYQFDSGFPRPLPASSGPAVSSSVTHAKTPRGYDRRGNRVRTTTSSSYLPGTSRRSVGSINPARSTPYGTSSNADSCVVIALTAGRGDARNEVGLAAIDLQYPYLILCQISDCQTYVNTLTKINILDPTEILMPETMCEHRGRGNKLYRSIKEKFNALNVTPISRTHFNESIGMERVRTLCARRYSSVELIVKQKYYALAATAALLKYVEYVQHMVYAPRSVRIEFHGSPNTTMIDIESARNLELVVSQSKHTVVSLLGTMDRCLTPMGRRLLRASILQPPCDERFIADRQSCVAELVANRSLCTSLQPTVQRLFGTDRLLTLAIKPLHVNDIQNAERNLNYALLLKNCLDIVPELQAVLAIGVHPFFVKTRKNLENSEFRVMKDKISTLIHADARYVKGCTSLSMQRCFAIKAGINDLLDVARQVYCELISDMKSTVEQLAVKHKLPLSLEYNANMGYHINVVIPRGLDITVSDLPTEFIQARKNRRSFTMTTTALLTLNKQCKKACEEIYVMSNTLLINLLEDVRQHVGCLFQLSADVAELDLVLSLAQISCNPEYVRPSFAARLELRGSLHPIMELFNTDLPVSNDVAASTAYNFHLITGPNMSGKSTYLKQIVLLQIMAQIGSYVPATKATFRIADRILCRICSRDDAELNASAYVLEMKEAQYILQSVTSNSLVVLDELCRHTTVEEGSAIAWSICERLALTSAFAFAATHFSHLVALGHLYHNVTTHCFETRTAEPDGSNKLHLVYTHKLNRGTAPTDHYGIALAEVSSLPKCVTTKAREYACRQQSVGATDNLRFTASPLWEKSCYDAVVQLRALLDDNRFTFATVISVMKQLDLDEHRETSAKRPVEEEETQVLDARSAAPRQTECEERREEREEESRGVPFTTPRDNSIVANPTTRPTDALPLAESRRDEIEPERANENRRPESQKDQAREDELMGIASEPALINDSQRTDTSLYQTIINRTISSLPQGFITNNVPSIITGVPSPMNFSASRLSDVNEIEMSSLERLSCYGSVTDDPRFYIRTSFATISSQRMTDPPRYETSVGSNNNNNNNAANSADLAALSLRSSRSSQYHDYCLSEDVFDITPPSQSTPMAKISARAKEAEIFRQIEGDAFDEQAFFDNTQVPVRIDLSDNDDVAMPQV